MVKNYKREVMYGDVAQLERLMDRRVSFLTKIAAGSAAQNNNTSGHIRVENRNGVFQYYHLRKTGETRGTYLRGKDRELARAIAQDDYNARVRRAAEKELHALRNYQKVLGCACVNSVYEKMTAGRKVLVKPVYLPDEECVAAWKDQPYTHVPVENASAENITKNGEQVRSKSEVLIANALSDAGIPYLYEKPLQLFDRTVLPDFTILDLRRRKTIYWEHFGMMEQEKYKDKAYEKIISYQRAGYMMGVDLIATFESSSRPLGTKEIGRMIAGLLAP